MLSVQSTSTHNKNTKLAMAELDAQTTAHIENASSVDITEHNSENEDVQDENEHSSCSDDLYQAGNEKDAVLTPRTAGSPVSSRKTPKSTRGTMSKGENGNDDGNEMNSTLGRIGSGGEQGGGDCLQSGDNSSSEDIYGGSPKGKNDELTEGGIEPINTQRSGSSDDNVLMDLAVEMVVEQSGRHGTEGRVSVDQGTVGNTDQ